MANDLTANPVYIDTVTGDIDIASGHTGVSNTTMYIDRVSFQGPTTSDVFLLKDASGNEVIKITAAGTADEERDLDGWPAQGLKALSADQTVTSGNILIYLR